MWLTGCWLAGWQARAPAWGTSLTSLSQLDWPAQQFIDGVTPICTDDVMQPLILHSPLLHSSFSLFPSFFLSCLLSALTINIPPLHHLWRTHVYVFNCVNKRRFVLKSLLSPLSLSIPLLQHTGLHEQKHLGRPSSRLGGVSKGGPGGALRARCAFFFF